MEIKEHWLTQSRALLKVLQCFVQKDESLEKKKKKSSKITTLFLCLSCFVCVCCHVLTTVRPLAFWLCAPGQSTIACNNESVLALPSERLVHLWKQKDFIPVGKISAMIYGLIF